jgi:BASS family bile acid:Na+ symporter
MNDTSVFATVLLPLALALIMGTLGLTLTPPDFTRIFKRPRGVLIGLANLVLISPLLAFAVAELYDLEPAFAVGLVLLGASPGGTLANFLTHLARGDTALSITMTALSSVASVVTVPLFLTLAVNHFNSSVGSDVSMLGVVARVFAITIIPLAIGMRIRARSPARAIALEPRARRVAFVVFVGVVVGAVINEFGTVTDHFTELALAALTLNVAAMTISFSIARLARLDDRQSTAIAMELGVHNAALAIAVGTSIDDLLGIPAAVYSVFQLFTAGAFARLMQRRNTVGADDSLAAGAHAPVS